MLHYDEKWAEIDSDMVRKGHEQVYAMMERVCANPAKLTTAEIRKLHERAADLVQAGKTGEKQDQGKFM